MKFIIHIVLNSMISRYVYNCYKSIYQRILDKLSIEQKFKFANVSLRVF
jgi:hypothetical protein